MVYYALQYNSNNRLVDLVLEVERKEEVICIHLLLDLI